MAHILVIEDDLDIQALLHDFLQEAGYDVSLAADGIEGYSAFGKGSFDLVLLDILLPKLDGYGVCELIRKESSVPIIMLTALDSEADQIRGPRLHGGRLYREALFHAHSAAKNRRGFAAGVKGKRR